MDNISSFSILCTIHTIPYNTLQYNTLHYITIQYITLKYITIHYNTLQFITTHYNILQYITIHYNTLQYIAINYNTLQYIHYITIHYSTGANSFCTICLYSPLQIPLGPLPSDNELRPLLCSRSVECKLENCFLSHMIYSMNVSTRYLNIFLSIILLACVKNRQINTWFKLCWGLDWSPWRELRHPWQPLGVTRGGSREAQNS